jgi:N-formylmaleamate deformylase
MLPWTETDLPVDGSRLRVYRTGQPGAPSVVLVHGLTDNARYWARTAEALAPTYDLVLYDARGHGQSGRAPHPFDEAVRVADLLSVVEALGLRQPALIGHSMGAATAAAAARRPGLARGVVVEDPPWMEVQLGPAERQAYLGQWKAELLRLRALPAETALAQRRAEHPEWDERDHALSLDARREVDPQVLDAYVPTRTPWREVVAGIDGPILLLTGENARGAFVTPEVAQAAAKLWRAGRWVHCPGASHSVRYSRFECYLGALERFLAEL